jgi:hypothetical protein
MWSHLKISCAQRADVLIARRLRGEVGRCSKVGGQFDIAVAQLASRGFEGAAAGVGSAISGCIGAKTIL